MSFILGLRYNRPARRYLARLYCLLRYGWASAHAEEWWPDLALTLPSAGDGAIRYRGQGIAPRLGHPGGGAGGRGRQLRRGGVPTPALAGGGAGERGPAR